MSVAICSLCKKDLSSDSEKKRRKRLHGEVCAKTRAVLIVEIEGSLEDYTASADSFLCRSCDTKLQGFSDLQYTLEGMMQEVHSFLAAFTLKQAGTRKRSGASPVNTFSKRAAVAQPRTQDLAVQSSPGVSVSMQFSIAEA